jgi:hypothetical protein
MILPMVAALAPYSRWLAPLPVVDLGRGLGHLLSISSVALRPLSNAGAA